MILSDELISNNSNFKKSVENEKIRSDKQSDAPND